MTHIMCFTQDEVEKRMRQGARFDDVEDYIDDLEDLSDEQKSALWLLAWSYLGWRRQREIARQTVMALTMFPTPQES